MLPRPAVYKSKYKEWRWSGGEVWVVEAWVWLQWWKWRWWRPKRLHLACCLVASLRPEPECESSPAETIFWRQVTRATEKYIALFINFTFGAAAQNRNSLLSEEYGIENLSLVFESREKTRRRPKDSPYSWTYVVLTRNS